MMEFTTRMKNAKLTQKEMYIVEEITRNIEKTAFLSGIQLAEKFGVSATFITRLVHKLGYEKFAEFKEQLEDLYKRTTSPYEMFQKFVSNGDVNDVIQNSIVQDLTNLSNMQSLINAEVLDRVVDCIDSSNTVYMTAMFASEIAVQALAHYLWRLGKKHLAVTGIGLSKRLEFSEIKKGDVLIAFSSQRILREIVDAVVFAKKQGAVTIAITDNSANPLAFASDFVLLAPVKGVAIDYTHVATLAMLNVIANCLAKKNPEIVAQTLEREEQRCSSRDLFCL